MVAASSTCGFVTGGADAPLGSVGHSSWYMVIRRRQIQTIKQLAGAVRIEKEKECDGGLVVWVKGVEIQQ